MPAVGYIWIDAICINQEDTFERTHQVNLMKSIFSEANAVLIWLGTSEGSSVKHSRVAMEHLSGWESNHSSAHVRHSFDANVTDSLSAMFNHPYWSRLWVVQEVCLAKKVFVHG
jgi:hypothetical protein